MKIYRLAFALIGIGVVAWLLAGCDRASGGKPADVDYFTCTMHPSVKAHRRADDRRRDHVCHPRTAALPDIYMLWRRRHLPEPGGPEAPAPLAGAPPETRRRRRWLAWSVLLAAALAAGGYFAWQRFIKAPEAASTALSQPPFATQAAGGLKVNFYHPQGALRFAENDVVIEFVDATSGEPVEVGTVRFDLDMNMPGMVMHSGSTVTATGEPGRYRAKVKPDMAGDWTAQLGYDGLRGQGSISFTVNVKL